MAGQQNGYEQGTNADYNRDYAIDETRLFRFLNDTAGCDEQVGRVQGGHEKDTVSESPAG